MFHNIMEDFMSDDVSSLTSFRSPDRLTNAQWIIVAFVFIALTVNIIAFDNMRRHIYDGLTDSSHTTFGADSDCMYYSLMNAAGDFTTLWNDLTMRFSLNIIGGCNRQKRELWRARLLHACMRAHRLDSETWRQPLAGSATVDWLVVHARPSG